MKKEMYGLGVCVLSSLAMLTPSLLLAGNDAAKPSKRESEIMYVLPKYEETAKEDRNGRRRATVSGWRNRQKGAGGQG